jgi:hypothetical protein
MWELGLSTPEQRKAAYKYGHEGLILLDGTFNVSDKRVLLFIVMVIDENWKGMSLPHMHTYTNVRFLLPAAVMLSECGPP